MPLLWGKTRCKEAAGWDERMASKLMVAGERRRRRRSRGRAMWERLQLLIVALMLTAHFS